MPRYRTNANLKNALLHLMIHGIVFVKRGLTSLGHGPAFRDWMDAINTSSVDDYARPISGYCITTTHDFSQEKSCNIQGSMWKCDKCGNTLVRAKSLGPPSDSCCIENVSEDPTCGNKLCHWHKRRMTSQTCQRRDEQAEQGSRCHDDWRTEYHHGSEPGPRRLRGKKDIQQAQEDCPAQQKICQAQLDPLTHRHRYLIWKHRLDRHPGGSGKGRRLSLPHLLPFPSLPPPEHHRCMN
ncbi:unnamed protein product [Triticum turgidum subsp. durum]|uniref:SprT-like domain-containing protein n=1 Tax=Triticum turgidum subsp. durum TaxID=4567 RepID=A0A9R0Y7D0_TRITD|nr:unnamed protein product [Triticum turgidum subsp. durum]